MPRFIIRENDTIRDIIGRVRDRDRYLRGVLDNMMKCQREYDRAVVVRIGLSGKGVHPHYRIEPEGGWFDGEERKLDALEDPEERRLIGAEVLATCFNAYHGSKHKKVDAWGHDELKDGSWSKGFMTVAEVRELLGEVRGYVPKVRPAS